MSGFFFFYLIWISWLYIIILCDNFVKNSLFITKFECHTISTHIYSQSDMRTIQIAIVIQQSFSLKNKSDQCHIMLHNGLSYCACGQEEMTWKCIENERIKMFSKFGCLSLLLGVPNASVLIQTADCTDRPQLQGFPLIIVFLTIFCRVCFVFVLICGFFYSSTNTSIGFNFFTKFIKSKNRKYWKSVSADITVHGDSHWVF